MNHTSFSTLLALVFALTACDQQESVVEPVEYVNPRVFNVEFTFELRPERGTFDRDKDLKLWLPTPREWDSQRAVQVLAVDPTPHAEYTDPEFGNRMFFWDFADEPDQDVYSVNLRYRLESFELQGDIDPGRVGPYDTSDPQYALYTRSTDHIEISPEIETLAREIVGDEDNPHRQARRIHDFVVENVRYRRVRPEKAAGTQALLSTAATDEDTGERYYEGECNLMAEFFVALSRSVGIPARAVTGMVGWGPWLEQEDLKLSDEANTRISADGLAAARLFGAFAGHRWAEYFLPNYGWIPADPTWDRFVRIGNERVIFSKGTDVLIGPDVPLGDGGGYGDQWIPLRDGRIDAFGWGVWNLARVRVANAKVLHSSDPFPADALAGYVTVPDSADPGAAVPAFNGREILGRIDDLARDSPDSGVGVAEALGEDPRLVQYRDQFIVHMLRGIVGDEAFRETVDAYTESRLSSGRPVPIRRFQKIAEASHGESLEWFFRQWLESEELPQLKLEDVDISDEGHRWLTRVSLHQLSDPIFRLRVPLAIEMEAETRTESVWLDAREAFFEFITPHRPQQITIDPGFDLLKIQTMPPVLEDLWRGWRDDMLVVYGTSAEAPANRAAAGGINSTFFGLDEQMVKADVDVTEADLNTRVIILLGRPETNIIARRFEADFPVRFEENRFSYEGVVYDAPTQGVAQIIGKPWDPEGLIIMYAGLSGGATRRVCDTSEWREELGGWFLIDYNGSYVIYDGHRRLLSGDWEAFDRNLVWTAPDSAVRQDS